MIKSNKRKKFLITSNQGRSIKSHKLRNHFFTFLGLFSVFFQIRKIFKISIFTLLFIVLIGGFIGFSFFSPYFKITKINPPIIQNLNIDIGQIQDFLKPYYGRNLLFVSTTSLEKDLQTKFPELKNIQITEKWPSELKISIELSVPIAKLLNEYNATYYFISEEGIVLPFFNKLELPLIKLKDYDQNLKTREQFMSKIKLQNILQSAKFFSEKFELPIIEIQYFVYAQEFHLIVANSIHQSIQKNMKIKIDISNEASSVEKQLLKLTKESAVNNKKVYEIIGLYTKNLKHIDLRIRNKIYYLDCTNQPNICLENNDEELKN